MLAGFGGGGLDGGKVGIEMGLLGRNASRGLFMGISTIWVVVLMAMASVSLFADGADPNHLFESKGSLDAFFGTSPAPASSPAAGGVIRGRFIRNVPEGMLVKCGKVRGLILLQGYPHRGGLAWGDPVEAIAHDEGTTYSFTNSKGVDRTIEVYVFDAVFTATNQSEIDSTQPVPVVAAFAVQGSKPRGLPDRGGEERPHSPAPAPDKGPSTARTERQEPVKSSSFPDKTPPEGEVPRGGEVPMVPPRP